MLNEFYLHLLFSSQCPATLHFLVSWSLGKNHHHWSTIKDPFHWKPPWTYRWRPPDSHWSSQFFIEDPHIFIRDHKNFIGQPNNFDGDPNIFIGDPQIFIGGSLILVGDPQTI